MTKFRRISFIKRAFLLKNGHKTIDKQIYGVKIRVGICVGNFKAVDSSGISDGVNLANLSEHNPEGWRKAKSGL